MANARSRLQLQNTIENGIRASLQTLCMRLERDEASDDARLRFQEALSHSIAEAIAEAVTRGVRP